MHVPEFPFDVGSSGGYNHFLLPDRRASQRGEVYQDKDGDGRFSMDCSVIWSAFLAILDGPSGPVCGEDTARQECHLIWYVDDILILG